MLALRTLLVLAAAAGCASVNVHAEYDGAANFKGYRTYEWVLEPGPSEGAATRDPRVREAVIRGVDGSLAAKGLRRVGSGQNADLLVAFHGWAISRVDVRRSTSASYELATSAVYPTSFTDTIEVKVHRDGRLVIDLIDAATGQTVWRGTAMDVAAGSEVRAITHAVQVTLDLYPPRSN